LFVFATGASESTTAIRFGFASGEAGKQVLTNRDAFIQRLSGFDRAARLKTNRAVEEAEFLEFVGENVLTFTAGETNLLWDAVQKFRPKLEQYTFRWPLRILFIKTTGKEEGNAAYTRGNAIIIPEKELHGGRVESLLAHELFHIISRHNPAVKEALYEAIGFKKCPEVRLPESVVWITNPDAPVNDHWIAVRNGGKELKAVPVLLATSRTYDPAKGGEFFNYLNFKFLVRGSDDAGNQQSKDKPEFVDAGEVQGFFEQVGRNTDYIIHPEEILADNFVMLINDAKPVKSPEVLNRIRAVLKQKIIRSKDQ
jgi:hypothetical protein